MIDVDNVESSPKLNINQKYRNYEAWAYAMRNTPEGLDTHLKYARQYPSAKTLKIPNVDDNKIVEHQADVIQVARWVKPLAWTEGRPKDTRLPLDDAERVGWIIPMYMPGTIWYNLFNSKTMYERAKEYNYKSSKRKYKSWNENQ